MNVTDEDCSMIDYKKINKEISQRKWDRIHNKNVDEFTCYYCPGSGHDLCTHPEHCVLDKDFQRLHGKIKSDKKELKLLETIYEESIKLKQEFPEKNYEDFFVGFNPRDNRIRRGVLKKNIRKSYAELRNLKTKKGGY